MTHTLSRPFAIALALVLAIATVLVGVSTASPASAVEPGNITGKVTGTDAPGGIGGLAVLFYQAGTSTYKGTATTTSDGKFTSPDLLPGNYAVLFWPEVSAPSARKYIQEFYNDTYTIATATVVSVSAGTTTGGTNSVLAIGAKLSGTVTGQLGPHTDEEWSLYLDNPADPAFSRLISIPWDGKWTIDGVPAGTYTLQYQDVGFLGDPVKSYRTQWHSQKLSSGSATVITVVGTTPQVFTAKMSVAGPVDVDRISGATRYDTAVAISQNFHPFNFSVKSTVYVASGQNYPDALSAAAAAAHREGPLLLTQPGSLPAAVKAELVRLKPANIVVVGGTGAVSSAVFNQLVAISNQTEVIRIGGADRYATSRAIVANAWAEQTSADAFVATGLNYPDALAAAAAAGKLDAPVILVKGTAATADSATKSLLGTLSTTQVYVAGGTGVVSNGIATSIDQLSGVSVTRLGGADRYDTSFIINNTMFTGSVSGVFLATGTGYADALAGAALAGALDEPLYTVKPTCVPLPVLHKLATANTFNVDLLGGTGALSANVFNMGNCPYVPAP